MESNVVVLHADNEPMVDVIDPGPHQIYRKPQISVEQRHLDDLDPDDIRVEMIYAGLCGTDVHLIETNPATGYIRCSAPAHIPAEGRVIGHEGVARVLAHAKGNRHQGCLIGRQPSLTQTGACKHTPSVCRLHSCCRFQHALLIAKPQYGGIPGPA